MSAQTVVKLKGYVTPEQVADFFKNHLGADYVLNGVTLHQIDDTEKFKQYIKAYYSDDKSMKVNYGNITVSFNNRFSRIIAYSHANYNYCNFTDASCKYEQEIRNSETTWLSVGVDYESYMLLERLAKHFGGWICPNNERTTFVIA